MQVSRFRSQVEDPHAYARRDRVLLTLVVPVVFLVLPVTVLFTL